MQIITIEDKEFDELLHAWKGGRVVGRLWRKGQMQIVCATSHFVLIMNEDNPSKIAIRPARSQNDAEEMALKFLVEEEDNGCEVQRT